MAVFIGMRSEAKHIRFSLVHSSLGKLLLAAANPPIDRSLEFCGSAQLDSFNGFLVAKRLVDDAEEVSAQVTYQAIADNPNWLKTCGGTQHLSKNIIRARSLGVDLFFVGDPVPSEMRENLVELALKTPLHFLVEFLTYARSDKSGLSDLHQALVTDLVEHKGELAKNALKTPLAHLVTFLEYIQLDESGFPAINGAFAQNILSLIDEEEWNRRRAGENPQQPDFMANVARLFYRMGRPELIKVPARILMIEAADSNAWHAPGIGLNHLSNTIRFSTGAKHDHLVRFFDRIVTPEWLDRNYARAKPGGLAASLLSLAINLPPEFHSKFAIPSLNVRLEKELAAMSPDGINAWAIIISFIGSAVIVGAIPSCNGVRWPDLSAIAQLVELRRPDENRFGIYQIQFWWGLRYMVRQRSDTVNVPPDEAKLVLESWRQVEAPTSFAEACNASMIAWLDECEAADWVLRRTGPLIRDDIITYFNAGNKGDATLSQIQRGQQRGRYR